MNKLFRFLLCAPRRDAANLVQHGKTSIQVYWQEIAEGKRRKMARRVFCFVAVSYTRYWVKQPNERLAMFTTAPQKKCCSFLVPIVVSSEVRHP